MMFPMKFIFPTLHEWETWKQNNLTSRMIILDISTHDDSIIVTIDLPDERMHERATEIWGSFDDVRDHPSGKGLRFYRDGQYLGTIWRF